MWIRCWRMRRKYLIMAIFLLFCLVFVYWSVIRLANYILINSRLSRQRPLKTMRPRYGMNVIVGHYIGTGNLFGSFSQDTLNENNFHPIPGEGSNGKPVVIPPREMLVMQRQFQINRYNLLASDRIPLNRTLPEIRKKRCITKRYDTDLPSTSVIIVFHNEAWSVLLRTVWSVINRSPTKFLKEIILVDDASDRDFLKTKLDEYVAQLPVKIRVLRQPTREGLVTARLLGAQEAKGEILTFLDAHCECTVGWLEPLLQRVKENRRKVVCPVIDIISDENFAYIKSFELHWGAFNWELHFRWYLLSSKVLSTRKENNVQPFPTPAMAGGLFSIDRNYFYEIGAYDKEMKIWGGDNLEMSFRIWQCGGEIEIVPCSHVGHLFRKSTPYTFPGGMTKIMNVNLARLALVWMDDWADFFLKYNNIPKEIANDLDISDRQDLRRQLQCDSFEWYLKHVWPENFFPNRNRFFGKVLIVDSNSEEHYNYLNLLSDFDFDQNRDWTYLIDYFNKKVDRFKLIKFEKSKRYCLSRPKTQSTSNIPFGKGYLQQCHNDTTMNELFVITSDGAFMMNEGICLDTFESTEHNVTNSNVRIVTCTDVDHQKWLYDVKTQEIIQKSSDLCLTGNSKLEDAFYTNENPDKMFDYTLAVCNGSKFQKWILLPLSWT